MKQIYTLAVKTTYSTHIQAGMQPMHIPVKRNSTGWRTAVSVISTLAFAFFSFMAGAQNCPTSGSHNQVSNENTYFPGTSSSVSAHATSITVGAAGSGTGFGNTPISIGDILLIIQMQGVKINVPSNNQSTKYGANVSGKGGGDISSNFMAGNMEFAIAASNVPIGGGTLNLSAGLTYSYKKSAYSSGGDGQYTYQIIRVPSYYNLRLAAPSGIIKTPLWNGSTGGVTVISAVNQLDFNGQTISAVGAGFRGGGGIKKTGASGTTIFDYYTSSGTNANGSKGEGIGGTPRYMNSYQGTAIVDNVVEGYPGGSFAMGAPANAGGGATDSNPTSNDENAGGGGGGNGGAGGLGGNGWLVYGYSGGIGGSAYGVGYLITSTSASPSKLVMGGGGGAGDTNNATGSLGAFSSSGSSGGGIVLVSALTITGTGTIDASADNSFDKNVLNDGSGGGGAGGSILIYANSGQSGITALAKGANGVSNYPSSASATQHGPGGGGGGGVIFSNGALNPSSSAVAGSAGISYGSSATNSFNAQDGRDGILTQTFPFSQLPPNMTICTIKVLPATITDFYATYVASNNVKLSWSTTDEINAAYYEVERSTNAVDFTTVAQVSADQSGASVHNYTTNDQLAGVSSNIVYYRLRIVDESGKFVYSKVVPVKLDLPETSFSVYPNPVDSYTILNLLSNKQTTGMLRLIDNSGRQILTRTITVNNGANSIVLDQLDNLPRGLYIVQVLLDNNLYNQKLLKK